MSSTSNNYIAIIDDDEDLCRSMSRLLRAAHLRPITYSSAEEFLADTKRPKFGCLVLDIQLKGMSGLDLHQRLSAVKDSTPVVFITAHDDPKVRMHAESCDCAGYFRKRASGTDIITAIRRAIDLEDSGSPHKHRNPDPELIP